MDKGAKTMLICGIITVVLIVVCVFFSEDIIGFFQG